MHTRQARRTSPNSLRSRYAAAVIGSCTAARSSSASPWCKKRRVLAAGNPVVLCGTVRALGTSWAHRLVNSVRRHGGVRVFAVQMEEEAFVELLSPDGAIARWWEDPAKAVTDLIAALRVHYPLDAGSTPLPTGDAERRYVELALESCDIIDLANLPESDRHVSTRHLELRRLFVPLRVYGEPSDGVQEPVTAIRDDESSSNTLRGTLRPGSTAPVVAVGECLARARRLVVLGDPGSGKSTLVRWIVTAYLLRLRTDPDWKDLPDVHTLPEEPWLPVLIRWRDLEPSATRGSLDEVLRHTLRKAELSRDEAEGLRSVIRSRLAAGHAILLIDGLDEIADPTLRASFCRQVEQIQVAFPRAPMIVTSRIVGYREMGIRLGRGFEHVTVADLSRADKDDFVRRWCTLTETPERRAGATADLIRDVHSSGRIEQLTGNPMLLTTLALVKRKVGKLPNRRADLYWEAIQVLLNWRAEVDEPLDVREALPQLEYLAYVMCERGVQRLRQDEVLDLLAQMRSEYPQIHGARAHTPEQFLASLERRTGILVEAGHIRHLGMSMPVFEFRHLTFQEYLAARALVDGRYPLCQRG